MQQIAQRYEVKLSFVNAKISILCETTENVQPFGFYGFLALKIEREKKAVFLRKITRQ
jgi:hypothetical protein